MNGKILQEFMTLTVLFVLLCIRKILTDSIGFLKM
jgi:hypothetical protein